MATATGDPRDSHPQLEWCYWSITRLDGLRDGLSARAAVYMTANALLLAGAVFVIQALSDSIGSSGRLVAALLLVPTALLAALVCLSTVRLSRAIASGGPLLDEKRFGTAPRFFFHPGATTRRYPDFSEFEADLERQEEDDFIRYASADIWIQMLAIQQRVSHMRAATKYLVWAVVVLIADIGLLLSRVVATTGSAQSAN